MHWHWFVLLLLLSASGALARWDKNATLRIGGVMPLDGGAAYQSGRRGRVVMELAAEDINANPHLLPRNRVEIVINDSLSSPETGLRAAVWQIEHAKVVGIVGDFFSTVSKAVALYAGIHHVPVISPASTSADLSSSAYYPFFSRTIPPDSQQSRAIIDLFMHFGWKTGVILHSADDYGTAFVSRIHEVVRVEGKPITFVATLSFNPEEPESVRNAVYAVSKMFASRIIVVICLEAHIRAVLEAAAENDMIGKYIFVGVDAWTQAWTVNDIADPVEKAKMAKWMRGVVGTVPRIGNSTHTFDLLQRCKERDPCDCEEPESDAYILYLYDAMMLFANALHKVIESDTPFDGYNLLKAIRDTRFEGVTGEVRLDENGDRIAEYDIVNFALPEDVATDAPEDHRDERFVFRVVGRWRQDGDPTLSMARPIIWPDGSSTIPSDAPPREVLEYSKGLKV